MSMVYESDDRKLQKKKKYLNIFVYKNMLKKEKRRTTDLMLFLRHHKIMKFMRYYIFYFNT